MSLKSKLNLDQDPIYLVDGSSFLYRAFHAFPDLQRSDGFPTNALYIILRILIRLIRDEQPSYLGFFLDGKAPTFRHQLFPAYKAQRPKMPETLSRQIPPLMEVTNLLGLHNVLAEEVEADDLIASLAQRFKQELPVVIVGSDKDLKQCLDEQVFLWDPGQKSSKLTTLQDFREKQELNPEQWPDFQALIGDSSDNIPGIPGIGPKSALKLLKRYPDIQSLKANFHLLTAKEQEKIQPRLQELSIYRQLTALRTDLYPESKLEDFKRSKIQKEHLHDFFKRYEFNSLLNEFPLDSRQDDSPESQASQITKKELAPNGQLPSLRDEKVGLVPGENSYYLAVGENEFLDNWDAASLLSGLQEAQQIFLPDYKELLYLDQLWENLPREKCFDLSIAAYLLDPEKRDYSWENILRTYAGELNLHVDNQGLGALKIGTLLDKKLEEAKLKELLREIEMPLVPVLVDMERRGVGIDLQAFNNFLQEVQNELQTLTRSIYDRAGKEFNLRSSQQLAQVLFEDLKLKSSRKTPGGVPSTSSQVLENLSGQHPIIEDILRYRRLEKLRSTYLSPLPRMVDEQQRLHSHFNNLATATGRLSSSSPNLQNIPIRGEFGPRMRSCFVAPSSCRLIAADYSQIELRLLAHMSADPELTSAFAHNEDIHNRTAALLFSKGAEDILPDERRKAKTINFGLLYGMGPQKLGRELGIPLAQAKEFIAIYFSRLDKVREFYEGIEALAKEQGYVTTLSGRRRLLRDINSQNANLAQQARRMAINTVIQGSAADIIKMAMIRVSQDRELQKAEARLILQVHDELLLEAPAQMAHTAGKRLAEIMSTIVQLSIPLAVDWGLGRSWNEAH
jgi:DNA polymerase-1